MLADELAMTPAALNHHLTRLIDSGLLTYANEGKGWRRYMLRGGGLTQALELCSAQYRLMIEQKMDRIDSFWKRTGERLPNELSEESPLPLTIAIVDYRPPNEEAGASVLTQWMADLGMLGERPGDELREGSISERLFKMLLESDTPISLDDAEEAIPGQKARLRRMFERFRTCGLIERIPRTDRLPGALVGHGNPTST